jgi:hypothetical protein
LTDKVSSAEFYVRPSQATGLFEGSVILVTESGQLMQFGYPDRLDAFDPLSGSVRVRRVQELNMGTESVVSDSSIDARGSISVVPNREVQSVYSTLADTTSEFLPTVHEIYGMSSLVAVIIYPG